MCKLYFFVQYASYTASLLLLTLISVERYFAIIHPILSKRLTGMGLMRAAVVVVWLIAVAYSSPSLFAQHFTITESRSVPNATHVTNVTEHFCISNSAMNEKVFTVVNFVLMYLVPLGLMTVMYTRISVLLWKTSQMGTGESMLGGTSSATMRMRRLNRNDSERLCTDITDFDSPSVSRSEAETGHSDHSPTKSPRCSRKTSMSLLIKSLRGHERAKTSLSLPISFGKKHRQVTTSSTSHDEDSCCNSSHPDAKPQVYIKSSTDDSAGSPLVKGGAQSSQNGVSTKKPSKRSPRPSNPLVARRKVIRLLIVVVISFALCVLPHHIRQLYHICFASSQTFADQLLLPVTYLVFFFNSCLNPFLYAFLSDNFRKAFRELTWINCLRSSQSRSASVFLSNRTLPYTVPTTGGRLDLQVQGKPAH